VDATNRGLQHVALPTACTVVYWHVSGTEPDPRDTGSYQSLLNTVARALGSVVPVYFQDECSTMPLQIQVADLLEGHFSRGAHVFVTSSGMELRGLTVQRFEMKAAIQVLRSAGVRFRLGS
jgi:hypothetical protein